ncbi:hypothetical protein SUGI_0721360 [Cryptomeria japonica]|nr:hypothetical protein SUGI_0721360 [Cryptomeria japonica]
MVWAANGDRLVQDNATLGHTSTGDLMLNDTDGTLVWSTNAFTTGFQAMVMEESGNLVLLNGSNGTMWQSFDHPTDTLLLGQKLKVRQKLTAYISPTNTSKGSPANPVAFSVSIPRDSLYLKIYYDGYLKFYSLQEKVGRVDFDKYTSVLRRCEYSTACGEYAICTVALFLLLWVLFYKLGKGMQEEQNEEDLDFPAGLPGILFDNSKVAVKRLDRAGQGSREFRAEVETLGTIHHLNLEKERAYITKEGRFFDLVDSEIKDEGIDAEQEAVEVLGILLFCIQYDFTRRPEMSSIGKALEDMSEMDQVPPVFTALPNQPLLYSEDFNEKGFSSGPSASELSRSQMIFFSLSMNFFPSLQFFLTFAPGNQLKIVHF